MKRFILLLLGFTPYVVGKLVQLTVTLFPNIVFPFALIGLIVLSIWFLIAFYFGKHARNITQAIVLLNLPAFIVLVLLGMQELILGQYWLNVMGSFTQLFYLPFLRMGWIVTSWSHTVFPAYFTAFIAMVAVSFMGYKTYQKQNESK